MLIAGLASDHRDGCPVEPIASEAVNGSPQVRDASTRAFNGWCNAVAERLRKTDGRSHRGQPDSTRRDRPDRGRVDALAGRRRSRRTGRGESGRAHTAQPCASSSRVRVMIAPACSMVVRKGSARSSGRHVAGPDESATVGAVRDDLHRGVVVPGSHGVSDHRVDDPTRIVIAGDQPLPSDHAVRERHHTDVALGVGRDHQPACHSDRTVRPVADHPPYLRRVDANRELGAYRCHGPT